MVDKHKIDAALKKKERRKHGIRSWGRKNGYKIMRVILWFVWLPMYAYNKWRDKKRKEFVENPLKTKKWLDKVFLKMVSYYCSDSKVILIMLGNDSDFCADFCTEDFVKKYVVGRRAKRYFEQLTRKQREEMIKNYVIDGYTKVYLQNWVDWDKIAQKLGWETNWAKDRDKAVVFYAED